MKVKMDSVIKVIDQIILQVRIWDEQLMRMKLTSNQIVVCTRVKMNLIACKDHDHPRINGEIDDSDKELFSVFYISSHLKEIKFSEYIKLVLNKIPGQQEQADKMTALFSKLSPLLK
jgi:hypothetical protein